LAADTSFIIFAVKRIHTDMFEKYGFPDGKRYNSFVGYFKRKYGERLQKIVLDAGFTCPNRDGKVGRGGCTYCDNAAFHPSYSTAGKSLHQQMDEGIEFHKVRYRTTEHYLAYFQSFSNTYAPLERLRALYEEALKHPQVVGIVIGTRPDCVDEEKLDYLADLAQGRILKDWTRSLSGEEYRTAPIVIVEYGIESCYDSTLARINRGHDFETARRAVHMTAERGIDVGAHFILGLPGESRQMMLDSCAMINELPLRSVKFHQLQIVKGTRMEKEYAEVPEDFERFSLEEYLDFFVDMLERLRPDLFIERFVGEVPPRFVNETPWGLIRNVELLRLLEKKLEERGSWQGKRLESPETNS
jgi:radical SAM protein (TIGR01212 family)